MFLHVIEAEYLRDYVIWLRFNEGADLAPEFLYENMRVLA
jgi:hypothetical protein